jgi:phage terminase large subunit GpA-like protein
MDADARPAWPDRFNPDELSAVQNCMNLRIDNPHGFAAEYQNDPQPELLGQLEELDPDQVAGKLNKVPRGAVPRECPRLTAGVDVQAKVIFWAVTAWDERFGGAVVDYGTFPPQNRAYFSAADARPSLADHFGERLGEEALVYAGLKAVTEMLLGRGFGQHETGHTLRVEKLLIDSGWQTETVYQFCRQSGAGSVVWPSKGRGVKAGDKPMSQWARKPGDRVGWNWRVDVEGPRNRVILFDANAWKSFVTERLRSAPGSPGCLWLPGEKAYEHQLFADHLTSEYRVVTVGRGRQVEEWKLRPERPENHWLDTLVMGAVGAGVLGLTFSAGAAAGDPPPPPRKGRKKVDIEELHKKAQGATR